MHALSNILGLHFGHDAAACVLTSGRIAGYALRERHNRVKHALGLTPDILDRVLRDAGLAESDIDAVAITSTQNVELMTGLLDSFTIDLTPHDAHGVPSPLISVFEASGRPVTSRLSRSVERSFRQPKSDLQSAAHRQLFPEGTTTDWDSLETVGWLDNYITTEDWNQDAGLDALAQRPVKLGKSVRFGFHLPVTVNWRGYSIPAYFVNHHMAHAASCYYRSGFRQAAVMTHDGFANGEAYHSGFFAVGEGSRLWPVTPHHLAIGALYDVAAVVLKLGEVGGPGKLMGLAPYGEPTMFEPRFVCNEVTAQERFGCSLVSAWISHFTEMIRRGEYDPSVLGSRDHMADATNADFAASTQKLFEETYLEAVRTLHRMLERSNMRCESLCLTGGTALNCPSNSRIAAEGPFRNVFVEPSCDDGGLCIGASLHLYHNLMGAPVEAPVPYCSPYLGGSFSREDVLRAIQFFGSDIRADEPDDIAKTAASDIAQDKIIGWFEGRSESGPRALGHRSILANPMQATNWRRVNDVKSREPWRPFAPAVLEEKATQWFSGCPIPSPYMLFTAHVISPNLPAITHVDGSSRIQTVDSSCGRFYDLLTAFEALTGVPVVLNTSFNGPGEPIVETPAEAICFLLDAKIDAVYLESFRVTVR